MELAFAPAQAEADARAIIALHEAIAARHRAVVGARPWRVPSVERVVASLVPPVTLLARLGESVVATFRLDPAKGFCGIARFTEVPRFVYLSDMAVAPTAQRKGIGRACLAEAERWARAHDAHAIRLDTNDDAVGARGFYAACHYREVLHHRETVYFERVF